MLIVFFILIFTGCESKSDLQELAKRLHDEKNTTVVQKHSTKKRILKIEEKPIQKEKLVNIEKKEKSEQIKAITDLNLTTLSKKNINLKFSDDGISFKTYPNKIVILDIFTTWCPPCIESIPHMNELQKKYKKNLQIIGVLMEDKIRESEALEFKQKHHINYPITFGKNNFILTKTWGGVSGYPTIIIFDKNGKYFNHYNGAPPLEMLESDMKKVLKK